MSSRICFFLRGLNNLILFVKVVVCQRYNWFVSVFKMSWFNEKNKGRGEINMKKFFNRVRSYISDHFTCSNPSCGYETYVKVIGNTYKCPECGGTMYRD